MNTPLASPRRQSQDAGSSEFGRFDGSAGNSHCGKLLLCVVLSSRPIANDVRILVAMALAFGVPLAAQQPTFRSSTQVVSLFATVTDAQNRLVPELTQDDFEVFDNDKPQQLLVFSE